MRVQILTQFYPPEIGATQARLSTFAEGLAAAGHAVDVVCELPNHPQGTFHPGWAGRPVRRHRTNGVGVKHVWVYARPVKTRASRVLFYGSYAAMAALVGSALPRPDVVFASSPPLPVGVAAAAVARWHRCPWVLDVRDLWPEAAVAMGELSEGPVADAVDRLARRLYEDADAITVTTEPFRDHIAERVSDPANIHMLPNGTTEFWFEAPELDRVSGRARLGLAADRFVWTFAGNIGGAQGLDAAIDAARLLGDGFQLLVLGDGPARDSLEQRARALPAKQVLFHDQVSAQVARDHLHASDCLLVTLGAHPALTAFVPSKLFDFCATGRPVVLGAGGEPQRVVQSSGAALCVPPGNPDELAAAVRRLREDVHLCEQLGQAGRSFAQRHLRSRQVELLNQVLAGL
jgi:hypothetical protein